MGFWVENVSRDIDNIRLHKRINKTAKLLPDMPEDNIVVLAFSLFFGIIGIKNRIVQANNSCDLKKGIAKIA